MIQQAKTEGSATDAEVCALQSELKKAEADYKILGVPRDCSEIIHHPDKVSRYYLHSCILAVNINNLDPNYIKYQLGLLVAAK